MTTDQALLAPPAMRTGLSRTFLAMMARDARVLRKNFTGTFLRVLMQPIMFVFVFSYVLPKIGAAGAMGGAAGDASFATILVPGLVASSMVMQAMMAAIMPLMMELTWQRSITDRALAPLPIPLLAIQKITAAALQGLLGGLLVFPAVLFIHAEGQAPEVHVGNWAVLIVMLVAGSLLAASGGMLMGTVIDPQKAQILFAVILLPVTMLGCVYYPWAALHDVRWLQIASLANPLVYVSEGLRAALTPDVGHMATWAFMLAVLGGTAVLMWIATRTFTKRVLT
ncbi:transport permease protein [Actinomadura sp. NBRC 104412]|uniref:ABC transporter permease n=1 Tax=Actinomadura sp. NBRC 104412 TaxID=3032203 RepID=UPI0024A5F574|nr:ABC transporter permease [Actinomadura sp. NBRC 104412]GLZ06918.1 transport permease protein [Actinomadura sp. NBRC 104412]